MRFSFWKKSLRVVPLVVSLLVSCIIYEAKSHPDEADRSLVILASATNELDDLTTLQALYGDPEVYVNEIKLEGRRSNLSREDRFWIRNETSQYSAGALEVDYGNSILFWSSEAKGLIKMYPSIIGDTRGSFLDLTQVAVSEKVSGLAFDWVSNLLYCSDVGYKRIGAYQLDNAAWLPIADTDLTSPQDVVVYPQLSYVFWSDAGTNPKIERMDMATNTRTIIVTSSVLLGPKTLAIDFRSQRLFWLDTGKVQIGSANFDGSEVSSFPLSLSDGGELSSFFLYKDFIVSVGRMQPSIDFYNMTLRKHLTRSTVPDVLGFSDAVMFEPTRQPHVPSPCNINNGECKSICITISSYSRKCACDMGWFLASDGTSCEAHPFVDNFLLVTDLDQRTVYQVDLDTGEVRGVLYTDIGFSPLAYNPSTNTIYWRDVVKGRILRSSLSDPSLNVYAESIGSSVTSLAFDPTSQLLYYVDYRQSSIQQILKTPDVYVNSRFFAQQGYRPLIIRLDVAGRLLYWADCGYMSIEVAMLNDSSNHWSIVSTPTGCAYALDVDFKSNILYWADEVGNIWQANVDGFWRKRIYSDSSADINALTLDEKYLYIGDLTKRFVQRVDRATYEVSNLTKILFTRPHSVLSYRSTVENPAEVAVPVTDTMRLASDKEILDAEKNTNPHHFASSSSTNGNVNMKM